MNNNNNFDNNNMNNNNCNNKMNNNNNFDNNNMNINNFNNNMNNNNNNINNNNNCNNNMNNNINNNNNCDNKMNNNITDIFANENCHFDISNMAYPSQAELEGDGEQKSFSYVKDVCPEMSLMADEELPQEIHIHPINKLSLSNEICSICNQKVTCIKGHKCNLCPLRICDNCVNSVISHFYSTDKHNHPLVLKEKENYQCDSCKKSKDFKNNFCFYCDQCNFGICLDCYIPRKKNDDNEQTHRM
jgi:hypothetical protein